eukprot:356694-Chlamydomonas_euryale.AAC.2
MRCCRCLCHRWLQAHAARSVLVRLYAAHMHMLRSHTALVACKYTDGPPQSAVFLRPQRPWPAHLDANIPRWYPAEDLMQPAGR